MLYDRRLAQGVGEEDDNGLWDAALCGDEVGPDPADIGVVDNDTSLWGYEVGPDLAAVLRGDEVVPDLAAVRGIDDIKAAQSWAQHS